MVFLIVGIKHLELSLLWRLSKSVDCAGGSVEIGSGRTNALETDHLRFNG